MNIVRTVTTPESDRLPNLILIGAMKCATTSLHFYLGLHPQISMSREKELNFFVRERNWPKGIDWYKSQFTGVAQIYGESSPSYTNYPIFTGVPERIAAVVPAAKLIYLVRDPIERTISHYIHEFAAHGEHRTFAAVMADFHDNRYLSRSLYYMQLEQYLRYFPRSQVLVMTQEELYAERRKTLETIFRFLDVEPSFSSWLFHHFRNRSRDKRRKTALGLRLARLPVMELLKRLPPEVQWHCERLLYLPFSRKVERPRLDTELQRRLVAYFQDDSRRLQEYAGRKFAGWCV
jgi:hypothetical protein